jgi:hypothetical protein
MVMPFAMLAILGATGRVRLSRTVLALHGTST